jgi:hypothetical protein
MATKTRLVNTESNTGNDVQISPKMQYKSSKKLNDYLMKHSAKNSDMPYTNTRMPDKVQDPKISGIYGGSYYISDEEYPDFLRLYASEILTKNREEYLTEKQLDSNGPILIDIDLHFDYAVDKRLYDISHIEDGIDIYLAELKTIYQFDENTKFNVYVMQKNDVNRVVEKNITKDGIHIIIGLQCERLTQILLRKKVIPKIAEAWSDFPIVNTWDGVFDEGVTKADAPWQLYGSRKPYHDVYKLTYIYEITYDTDDGEFIRNSINLKDFDVIENIDKLSARYTDHPSLFYTSEFIKTKESNGGLLNNVKQAKQKRMALNNYSDVNGYILKIKNRDELKDALDEFLDSIQSFDYELREAHDYTMTLPESYYGNGSYLKWIRVGWALRHTDQRLFLSWMKFSSQSSKFSFADISYILFLAETGRYPKSRTLKLALPKVVVKPTEF